MSLIKITFRIGREKQIRIGNEGEVEENLKRDLPSSFVIKVEPFEGHEEPQFIFPDDLGDPTKDHLK